MEGNREVALEAELLAARAQIQRLMQAMEGVTCLGDGRCSEESPCVVCIAREMTRPKPDVLMGWLTLDTRSHWFEGQKSVCGRWVDSWMMKQFVPKPHRAICRTCAKGVRSWQP